MPMTGKEEIRFFRKVEKEFQRLSLLPRNTTQTFDFLEDKDSPEYQISRRIKQNEMRRGHAWQFAIGNFPNWEDLKTGHKSGLDVKNSNKKRMGEIKSRTNTVNSTSKKGTYSKLATFKRENPEYMCFLGYISDKTEKSSMEGKKEEIKYEGEIIKIYTGMKLLKLIFGSDTDKVLIFMKKMNKKYLSL